MTWEVDSHSNPCMVASQGPPITTDIDHRWWFSNQSFVLPLLQK